MLERLMEAVKARSDGEPDGIEDGFTLVELLIVVVVLGILAAVTVFGLSGTTSTSVRAACNADARSVEIAVEAYHADNAPNWPTTYNDLEGKGNGVNKTVYLRTQPSSSHYTINLDASGTTGNIFVAAPGPNIPGGNNYDDGVNGVGGAPNPCSVLP